MTNSDGALLTTTEVAHKLGLDPRTVLKAAVHGELPAIRIGNRWRFPKFLIDGIAAGEWRPRQVEELPVYVPLKPTP